MSGGFLHKYVNINELDWLQREIEWVQTTLHKLLSVLKGLERVMPRKHF